MKTLLSTLLAALCLDAGAGVLIYKQRVSYTINGGGSTSRVSLSGYVIIDPEAANLVTLIQVNPKTKVFWMEWPDRVTIDYVEGTGGRQQAVWTRTDTWFDGDNNSNIIIDTVKGVATPQAGLTLGTVTNWNIPRSAKSMGTYIYPSNSGKPIMEESVGSMGLDVKTTKAVNLAGADTYDAEDRVRILLQSQGYTEI